MSEPIGPMINDLNRPFWAGAAAGKLVLPWCPATKRFFWPPSPSSPFATGLASEWRDAPVAGTLRTRAVYRRAFQKAFEDVMPYAVGELELNAGPRLQVHLGDADAAGTLRPGDRMVLTFNPILPGGLNVPWGSPETAS